MRDIIYSEGQIVIINRKTGEGNEGLWRSGSRASDKVTDKKREYGYRNAKHSCWYMGVVMIK